MASSGRRSEDRGEPSYDRDPLSHPYNQHQRRRQQFHNQGHYYNQPFPSSNGYPREQSQHGQLQSQQPPPALPYHQTGSATETNGNYNNNSSVPVPPRMRMRKWSDMTRTIWHYERIEQIGEGTYGQVYRARCKDTNEIVAMKKIRVHHGAHWGMPPTVIREIKILKRLVHPNLVRMIEVVSSKGVEHLDADDYHKGSDRSRKNKHKHKSEAGHGGADNNGKDNNNSTKNDNNINSKQSDISDAREGYKGNLFLVLEYVPHDLTGLLDVAYKFSEVEIKCVFRQLLGALRYMHDQKYVHRDIKSSNILIDRHFRLKLADFGLARSIEPPLLDNLHDRGSSQEFTNKVITLWYRPPELLLGATRYGFAVDIWSAGCILAELVLGRPLFTGKTEMDQLSLIFDMVGTPTSKSWPGIRDLKLLRTGDVSIDGDTNRKRPKLRERYQTKMNNNAPGAINLVEKLLELDPSKRLTASRALNNRYFLQEPRAPDQPEALGEMKLAEGGSFHEFQTKKKRKEAKVEAQKIKQAAEEGGLTVKQAQEEYDKCYREIMEKVAREGLGCSDVATTATNANEKEKENGKAHGQQREEKESREIREEKNVGAKERDHDGFDDRHSKHRSSKSDRNSIESKTSNSGSTREKDYRDSSSRGRERRARERSDGGNTSLNRQDNKERSDDKNDYEKNRDGSSKEASSSHRDRDHSREKVRSSRRNSESDDRRKKRRRDSAGEDKLERSTHIIREKDKERSRDHRKAPKVESGDNVNEVKAKKSEEKHKTEDVATDDKKAADTETSGKTKEITTAKSQSLPDKDEKESSKDVSSVAEKKEESKPDQDKQPGKEHRSISSRGDKKRSDRTRDRGRDHRHHRRSSKDRDGRTRDGDRDRSSKKRKSRARSRSRSPERGGSPGRSRDDRHHRHRRDRERDREHSRRERDDFRDMDRRHDGGEPSYDRDPSSHPYNRSRNDRNRYHDDWGSGMGGRGGPPPPMQRREGDFRGNPNNHRGPPPRDGRGDFHGPPGRHPGDGGHRGPPHPHGGRPPPRRHR